MISQFWFHRFKKFDGPGAGIIPISLSTVRSTVRIAAKWVLTSEDWIQVESRKSEGDKREP
ncbi:MAG: hypothetical protein CMF59_17050 [Leptospiraceae bacterium]|nr:hypothetical protein [Leptospiraceae bacterium]